MKNKNESYFIELPEEVIDLVEFKNHDEIELNIGDKGILLRTDASKKEHVPMKPVVIASVITLVTSFAVFFSFKQIPLTGYNSIATVVVIMGILTGMINFTYFFTKSKHSDIPMITSKIYWRNFPAVLFSYTILLVISLLFLFKVLDQLFLGASFDIYTSSIITTLMISVINYMMIYISRTLTPQSLIRSLIAIIIGGVTIAMITNKDQQWWTTNFSFLGTPDATNSWQFNLTLMLSALLMIALIDYLFVLLYSILGKTKGLIILKVLLIATAISLGGVGFFPYNFNEFSQQMHNRVAGYLVYLFIILIVSIRWLIPGLKKSFLLFSYAIGGSLILGVFLFLGIGYLSLTAFELITFILAFTWLLSLLKYLVDIVTYEGKRFKVKLSTIENNQ
ncbi:DUF998 domain-containing protein [Erysipelothrix urinaevulpis]|uniref:DUF998 domain-containing protein n=1 Tax=Erysipelothrix urinaevulpis TaxID=2683717 RepID=UPI0013584798|nr:DUF998 domain-containing protein [Erysipelothrix urinaevulpis]